MLPYFITLFVYLLSFTGAYLLTNNLTVSLIAKLVLVAACLIVYRKQFRFRIRFDILSLLLGLLIAVEWIALDVFLPVSPAAPAMPYHTIDIILKLLIGVVIAPVVEEFFTRFFISRWAISKDWEKVKLGHFTAASFIITAVFFGLSHETRWLAGIVTGILLNLLMMKTKNIESCILAHAVANLALGIYVVATGSFQFW